MQYRRAPCASTRTSLMHDHRRCDHAQVEAKVLRRMEEGGNEAERAMAAKYAKAIKADQVQHLT